MCAKFEKIRVFGNAHGSDIAPENRKQERKNKITKKTLDLCEKIVVPSVYFKNYLIDNYSKNVENKEIVVYPSGGIDPNVFYVADIDERQKFYDKFGLEKNKFYVGYCGRISKNKGLDTLIKAIEILNDKQNIEYIIVGNGEYEKQLRQLACALGVISKIHFFGMLNQEELCKIYNILDLFVFPTERVSESLGLVAIEAMACGTPVLGSDFAAPKYYIQNNMNGYKFAPRDFEKLASYIYNIANDRENLKRLSFGAYEFSKSFKCENVRKILINLFEKSDS